ncbi:MAG: ABC transporter permease, partial [Meiothermus sp.]|nr:ABC transporter permease [Meiothermus sp.]
MEIVIALFFSTLRQAAPLLLTALGGLFSERSGVVNIALEGMILFGAAAAAITVNRIEVATGGLEAFWIPWVGLLVGALVGGLVGLVHAVASIKYRADQIVSGTAINIAALGAPSIVLQVLYNNTSTSQEVQTRLPNVDLGPSSVSILVIFAFLLVPVVWWVLFKTPWG